MMSVSESFDDTCRQLLDAFFAKFPNEQLRGESFGVLPELLSRKVALPGKPGGWAAGIVYAISSIGVGVPSALST